MGAVEQANAERRACPVLEGSPEAVAKQGVKDARRLAEDVREIDPSQIWGRLSTWRTTDPERLLMAIIALAVLVPANAEIPAWVAKLAGGLTALQPPRIPQQQTRTAA